jgi:hypothetical protein
MAWAVFLAGWPDIDILSPGWSVAAVQPWRAIGPGLENSPCQFWIDEVKVGDGSFQGDFLRLIKFRPSMVRP